MMGLGKPQWQAKFEAAIAPAVAEILKGNSKF